MLDIKFIRENLDQVKKATSAKNLDTSLVDKTLKFYDQWTEKLQAYEELRRKRNKIAKVSTGYSEAGKKIKAQLVKAELEVNKSYKDYRDLLWQIPNIVSADTPLGKDESANKIIRKWGKPKKLDFTPKDHVELGELLGIIDIETASKVTGARFNYLKGDAVLLEFALVQYTFSILTNDEILREIADKVEKDYCPKPFVPILPPVMVKTDVFDKMARLRPVEERYYIPSDDLYLIGSAEHTLGPLHMDKLINDKDLPLRYVGFSTSFRREAGSYGKDTRGILRVHQFDKIEMESFTSPDNSIKEQNFFISIQEHLVQSLGIPYQVVAICSGDMGKPDFRQVDIEMWLPGQNKYRESHTSDLMTDYQSMRLNTKIKCKDGKVVYAHMNDATAFAIGRTIIAIFENYQNSDGSIGVPKVLQSYLGKDIISR